jgi:AraC-like DNA-binding protein
VKDFFNYSFIAVLGKIRADKTAAAAPLATPLAAAVEIVIRGNGGPRFCLKTTARRAHISPSYLATLFTSVVGLSYRDYAAAVRLAWAASQFANGEPRVADVALLLGYSQASNFVRDFRAGFQLCPSRWRKAYLAQMNRGERSRFALSTPGGESHAFARAESST